jgi:mannose-6-phosphate isomerase-like protein (cupin superfamily)
MRYTAGPAGRRRPPRISNVAPGAAPRERFPYATHLDILHGPLEVVDVQLLVDACTDCWYYQTLCQVNDSVLRLGVVQREYYWHEHEALDEFFYVVEGHLLVDVGGRTVDLAERPDFLVPKGMMHRTRAPQRTVILMIEESAIVPTGDEG